MRQVFGRDTDAAVDDGDGDVLTVGGRADRDAAFGVAGGQLTVHGYLRDAGRVRALVRMLTSAIRSRSRSVTMRGREGFG